LKDLEKVLEERTKSHDNSTQLLKNLLKEKDE